MTYDEVTEIISNIINVVKEYEEFFWVGTDGIFHNTENPNRQDELICCCGIGYYEESGNWIVTPWLYNMDCPAGFKSAHNARAYAFFWLNWIDSLYGYGPEEPDYEADWLAIKSNRSVIMNLFDMQAEKYKNELYAEEEKEANNEQETQDTDN